MRPVVNCRRGSVVEHLLGKKKAMGSIPIDGSKKYAMMGFMEFVLSLFASVVLAAETVLSPLADEVSLLSLSPAVLQPAVSFGALVTSTPTLPPVASPSAAPAILGIQVPEATPTATPTPVYRARQKHYAVALLGDSMVDTLGPDIPHLKRRLTSLFPGTTFTMLNYGAGATNIDAGLSRVTNSYSYLGQNIPSLVSQSPDVVVIESFAYNPYPYDEGALERHWLQLAAVVDTIENRLPGAKIIIAATIAPNSQLFGDGTAGLSFTPNDKRERTNTIKQYLDSTVKFAQSQGLPLADAFHASLMGNGDGNVLYINAGDHIHYSEAGRGLMAQKITEAIVSNRLLE